MACIEPREEAVRCFNKHERFPLSHLYFIFAHVSPLLSISFLSFSFRQPPECVKKNSFTLFIIHNHVQYCAIRPIFSPSLHSVCLLLASSLPSLSPFFTNFIYQPPRLLVPLPRLPPSFTIISRLKRDKKYYRWKKARR